MRSSSSADAEMLSRSSRFSLSMIFRRFLEALVLLQTTHQLGARIVFVRTFSRRRPRQQHARLDLREHRGHQQIFAGELQLQLRHHLDVLHVLTSDLGDRNVQDVEVLLADQVQQQIERPFERGQEHLQRVRRNIQIARQLGHRLAFDHSERHLALLWRQLDAQVLVLQLRAGVLHQLQFGLGLAHR